MELINAAKRGNYNKVEKLLREDVNTQEITGDTALILASEAGHKDIVRMLERYC